MAQHDVTGLVSFTSEGFLNILELSWDKMTRIDTRISRQMPYPVYKLCMTQLLYAQLLRISDATRQQGTWHARLQGEDAFHLVGGHQAAIPAEVYDWIQGMGAWTDSSGYPYNVNIPELIIPQPRRVLNRENMAGGDFGAPGAQNHNVYETMIAPLVIRRQIDACLANAPVGGHIQYAPLPLQLMPPGLQVTENLLGYEIATAPWHREALALYANAGNAWPTAAGLPSRLCMNPVIWAKVDSAIMSLSKKMSVVQGLPPISNGMRAVGTTIMDDDGDLQTVLRRSDGTLTSTHALDPLSIAQSAMYTYRRRRVEESAGYCFLTDALEAPPGWNATINSSYQMNAPFVSAYRDPDRALDITRFRLSLAQGRYVTIGAELFRRTLKD